MSNSKYSGDCPSTLATYAANGGSNDRLHAALNKYTDPETLKELAGDHVPDIRKAVAGNDNTTLDVLIELSKDDDNSVRTAAKEKRMDRIPILK